MENMTSIWRVLVVGVAISGILAFSAPPVLAAGDIPGIRCQHWADGRIHCLLWQNNVQVHAKPDGNSEVVGYLNQGDWSNWFISQCWGEHYTLGQWENGWWAYTQADNGNLGYVSLVYFKGGYNNQPQDGLPKTAGDICPTY